MNHFQATAVHGSPQPSCQTALINRRILRTRAVRSGKTHLAGYAEPEEPELKKGPRVDQDEDFCESISAGQGSQALGYTSGQCRAETPAWAQQILSVQIVDTKTTCPPEAPEPRGQDFYANVGKAVETLKEDTPFLFQRDLTYDIYREDIIFKDPRNSFQGLRFYKRMLFSLRWNGRIFFRNIHMEIRNIWLPKDDVIRVRWTVHGIPRIPWEAEGIFDGVSTYQLDRNGIIYEHAVDNIIFRDPPILQLPLFLGNLANQTPVQQPCPGAWYRTRFLLRRFSLVRMYAFFLTTMLVIQPGPTSWPCC